MRRLAFMDPLVLGIASGEKTVTRRIGDRRPCEVGDVVDVCEALVPLTAGAEDPPVVGYRCDRALALDRSLRGGPCPVPWPWRVRVLIARYCPGWAVRHRLRILDVRREPLSEVTDADARREGVARLGFLAAFRGIHKWGGGRGPAGLAHRIFQGDIVTHPATLSAPWALRRGAPVLLDGRQHIVRFATYDGRWFIDGTGESIDASRLALDCLDPLGRACLRMALAEGLVCPTCDGTHEAWTGVEEFGQMEMLVCRDCEATGWAFASAPHHWIGTASEGGALTPAHAEAAGMSLDELAGALLVCAATRVVAGLGGITGLVYAVSLPRSEAWLAGHGPVHWSLREDAGSLARGYARLGDAEGHPCLLLPEVSGG